MAIKNELGNYFFKILKELFPFTKKLYKMFNKNSIKLVYSCVPNVTSNINKINKGKLIFKN